MLLIPSSHFQHPKLNYFKKNNKPLVASSKSKTFGFLTKARAIAILYFWPPDNFTPLSPTLVSRPSGNTFRSFIKSYAFEDFKASSISNCAYYE